MKILEVNKFFYLRRGAERHFIDLVYLLEERGNEVAVFAMAHPENIDSPYSKFFPSYVGFNKNDSTIFERLKGILRLWSIGNQRKMELLLEKFHPDVVHIHNIYHQLSPSILAPIKKRGIPIVMTVHDYHLVSPDKDRSLRNLHGEWSQFLFDTKFSFSKRLILLLKFLIEKRFRLYDRFVDVYIVPSKYLADILIDSGIAREKVMVLPHFVFSSRGTMSSPGTSNRDRETSSENEKGNNYALYLGAVSEEKGANDIAGIFDRLKFPLIVAGAEENGFRPLRSKFVSFVGRKSKQEVQALLEGAKCMVSGSRLEETFGLVALEAISAGKPFFGMNVGAYPEIIRQGRDGFLGRDVSELELSLQKYLSGELKMDSGETLRHRAEREFDSTRYGDRILALFCSLVDQKK